MTNGVLFCILLSRSEATTSSNLTYWDGKKIDVYDAYYLTLHTKNHLVDRSDFLIAMINSASRCEHEEDPFHVHVTPWRRLASALTEAPITGTIVMIMMTAIAFLPRVCAENQFGHEDVYQLAGLWSLLPS